jgi:hypothetical protein
LSLRGCLHTLLVIGAAALADTELTFLSARRCLDKKPSEIQRQQQRPAIIYVSNLVCITALAHTKATSHTNKAKRRESTLCFSDPSARSRERLQQRCPNIATLHLLYGEILSQVAWNVEGGCAAILNQSVAHRKVRTPSSPPRRRHTQESFCCFFDQMRASL